MNILKITWLQDKYLQYRGQNKVKECREKSRVRTENTNEYNKQKAFLVIIKSSTGAPQGSVLGQFYRIQQNNVGRSQDNETVWLK